jgi:monoterpene epsilon-lactone hydrolase
MSWIIGLAFITWAITHFYLRGEDLSLYDHPRPEPFSNRPPSAEHQAIVESLSGFSEMVHGVPPRQHLALGRNHMDGFGRNVEFDGEIMPWNDGAVKGEWVVAAGADSRRRMLYIHGGAWIMGSSLSHRAITTRFANMISGAVLAVDYRLMPEHSRRDGIEDCRAAYQWIINHGPAGSEPADLVYTAGDSAGGNLVLALSAWIRDQQLPPPDAVIALSPATDSTLSSPSWSSNLATDPMLGPQFSRFLRIPKWLLWWAGWFSSRIPPSSPLVSPAFGDLSRLPPTLVQASDAEMLLDDACRYVNKACAHGSTAVLQTWPHMIHVWQFFESGLPEAREAFEQMHKFLEQYGSLPVMDTPS